MRRICHQLHLPLPSHAPLWRYQLRGPIPDSVFPAGVKVSTTHRTVHSLEDDSFALRLIKHDRGSGEVSYTRMDRKADGTSIRNELANERQYDALVREAGRKVTQTVVRSFVWEGRYMELNEYPQRSTTRQGADMSLDIEPWDGDIDEHVDPYQSRQEEETNAEDHAQKSPQSAVASNAGGESCGIKHPRAHQQLSLPHFLKRFLVSSRQSCDRGSSSGGADLKRSAEPDGSSSGRRTDIGAINRPTKCSKTALVQVNGDTGESPSRPFLKRSLTHLDAAEPSARPPEAVALDEGEAGGQACSAGARGGRVHSSRGGASWHRHRVHLEQKNSPEDKKEAQVEQDGVESEELSFTAFTQEAAESDSENDDSGRKEDVPSPSLSYA
jgi:hypothetical protein